MKIANKMVEEILLRHPDATILYCISPLVNEMEGDRTTRQRIFPKIFNAHSDHRIFYQVDECSLPRIPESATPASHGLVHVDHRLLTKEAQEMSILVSCSLAKSSIFVPPFNKWNKDTEQICEEHGIKLVKFEEGWLYAEYNQFDPSHDKWYLHSREFTIYSFTKWLDDAC
jgi:hypothetical protein